MCIPEKRTIFHFTRRRSPICTLLILYLTRRRSDFGDNFPPGESHKLNSAHFHFASATFVPLVHVRIPVVTVIELQVLTFVKSLHVFLLTFCLSPVK